MPQQYLPFPLAKQQPIGTMIIVTYDDEGTRYAIGYISPSARRDMLKLSMVYQGSIKELKLVEKEEGILAEKGGKTEYTLWTTTEKEQESGRMLLKKWGVRV